MRQPWEMPAILVQVSERTKSDSSRAMLLSALELLMPSRPVTRADQPVPAIPTEIQTLSETWPPNLRDYVRRAVPLLMDSSLRDSVLVDLSAAEQAFVRDTIRELVLEDADDKYLSPEALDSLQGLEDGWAVRFTPLAERLRWQEPVARLAVQLAALTEAVPNINPSDWPTDVVLRLETSFGAVILGTTGDDVFTGDAALIIDPGGNDTYQLSPLPAGRNRLILDYGGNDRYFAPDGHDLGSAQFGWSVLIDFAGDDLYQGGSFTMGAGWFGVGALLDRTGNDIYIGDTFTQGAGAFGVGLLLDADGNDQYTARLFSQGMGFAAGVGILAEGGGNDVYFAGGKYEDILRYRDHHLSLSQGFAYGIRPHFSGGVGLLLDNDGNDTYIADIFGQGCSYWWGFGGLYDGGGNDHYIAYQYAQGSATHMTAGCLYDAAGDDRYESKGVSQGCGHDWAVGMLIDREGNDRYTATDLSQAAGSANGVGILIDGGGDDGYYVVSNLNTQGYGNPRREYGSIGLFLDLGGRDRYDPPGRGAEGAIWLSTGKWGVGVDADSSWLAPPPAGNAP